MDGKESTEIQEVVVEAQQDGAVTSTVPSDPVPKKRGRPKGSVNGATKIAKEAIAEAEPHVFLIRVMEGRKFRRAGSEGARRTVDCFPTLQESICAAQTLLKKIAPDLRSQELSGPDGADLAGPAVPARDLARRVALLLSRGDSGPPAPAANGITAASRTPLARDTTAPAPMPRAP
jgi:hypothetical protein